MPESKPPRPELMTMRGKRLIYEAKGPIAPMPRVIRVTRWFGCPPLPPAPMLILVANGLDGQTSFEQVADVDCPLWASKG